MPCLKTKGPFLIFRVPLDLRGVQINGEEGVGRDSVTEVLWVEERRGACNQKGVLDQKRDRRGRGDVRIV